MDGVSYTAANNGNPIPSGLSFDSNHPHNKPEEANVCYGGKFEFVTPFQVSSNEIESAKYVKLLFKKTDHKNRNNWEGHAHLRFEVMVYDVIKSGINMLCAQPTTDSPTAVNVDVGEYEEDHEIKTDSFLCAAGGDLCSKKYCPSAYQSKCNPTPIGSGGTIYIEEILNSSTISYLELEYDDYLSQFSLKENCRSFERYGCRFVDTGTTSYSKEGVLLAEIGSPLIANGAPAASLLKVFYRGDPLSLQLSLECGYDIEHPDATGLLRLSYSVNVSVKDTDKPVPSVPPRFITKPNSTYDLQIGEDVQI